MPQRPGRSAASHPSLALLWDQVLSFCGCFFSPDEIKPTVHMRWGCETNCWEQSGCIQEKQDIWGSNSSPHEHRGTHRTEGSGSPLDGFPRIYSSAIKLYAGAKSQQHGSKVVVLLFICRFASPCSRGVRVLSAGVTAFEHCMAKKPRHARRGGEGSSTGSALLSLHAPRGLLRTERRQ